MKTDKITTPQFKTELIRKIKNIYPEYEVIFSKDIEKGIGFKLKNKNSSSVSETVKIYRYHENILNKDWLIHSIKFTGSKL